MKRKFLYEEYIDEVTNPDDVDLSSFDLKNELCPDFWNEDGKLDPYIRRELLLISQDVIETFDVEGMEFDDIVITGSIANYNWNEYYSDIDLHIIVDFASVNNDTVLVKKYFDAFRKNWNDTHNDISIYGYPVEVYIQDSKEKHKSTGVYSILDDKWVIEPNIKKLDKASVHDDKIKKTASDFMNSIDELQERLDNDENPEEINTDAEELFDDLKEIRKSSMSGDSEMTDGNLIFKTLRRNGYIEKLLDIRTKSYDKYRSIN